jgi:hypothetical protein
MATRRRNFVPRQVNETSRTEIVPTSPSDTFSVFWRVAGFFGKNTGVISWPGFLYGSFREVFFCTILGLVVALVRWQSTCANVILESFIIGCATGLVYIVGTRFPYDHAFRPHLFSCITAAYMCTNDIGFLGWLWYSILQLAGATVGGGLAQAFLEGNTNTTVCQSTIPMTMSLGGTTGVPVLGTVFGVELFGAAVIPAVLLLAEFLETRRREGVTGKEPDYSDRSKAFARASLITGVVMIAIITFSYQFQIYTFNSVTYFAGLFASNQMASPHNMNTLAQLATTTFTGSVWTNGSAWAFFYFWPTVGGLTGGLFFWLFFLARRMSGKESVDEPIMQRKVRAAAAPATASDATVPLLQAQYRAAATQQSHMGTRLEDLADPFKTV